MVRIIFLGTGGFLNYERAQTSLALPLADGETLLVDTTDGIALLRQLQRAAIPLASIRHLLISHQHPDHTGGLAYVLVARAAWGNEVPLSVYATRATLRALRATLNATLPGWKLFSTQVRWRELVHGTPLNAGSAVVTPFAVDHAVGCVGFRLVQDGKSVVFTADTRPCSNVIEYASGADLLVHEVASLDDSADSAHSQGHSTAADAGRIARAAGVRRLILTHLPTSQLVDPTALGAEAAASFGHPVELANDLYVVDL